MSERVLELKGVGRTFIQGGQSLVALRETSLSLAAGEAVALVGPSGAGKSTLLTIAGLLEPPDEGEVTILGTACNGLGDRERTALRRRRLGFVYQFHHLLPEFTALENVAMPQLIAGARPAEARQRARDLLGSLGLAARLGHRPAQLSGGEQQRVAVARALANRPAILLADEPTGNLDPRTAEAVMERLLAEARGRNLAALVATHNMHLAARMDRMIHLLPGSPSTGSG